MLNFSTWDVIKILVLWPFLWIWALIKSYRPKTYKLNNAIRENLYDLMDEVKYFVEATGKGPTELNKYNIRGGSPGEVHIEFYYLSPEPRKQNRLCFLIKANDEHFSYGNGGRSGAGFSYVKKENLDYDKLAEKLYLSIETANLEKDYGTHKRTRTWQKEIIGDVLSKYELPQTDFYVVRRALIVFSHPIEHKRYKKAKQDLIEKMGSIEVVNCLLKDMENVYSSKLVTERLL